MTARRDGPTGTEETIAGGLGSAVAYRDFFERSVAPMGSASLDGVLLAVNSAFCDWLGYTEDELIGRRTHEITHPDDLGITATQLAEMGQPGARFSLEKRYLRQDGTPVWGLLLGITACAADGTPTHVEFVVQDISALKETESRLKGSEALYRGLYEASSDAIVIVDDAGRYVEVNDAACRLGGRSREELLGTYAFSDAPVPLEVAQAMWQGFLEQGELAGEFVIPLPDGSSVVVEYRAVTNVAPDRHLAIVRDVTARKRLEDELAYQARILQQLERAIIAVDFDNRILSWNKHAETLYQWTAEEAIGRNIVDLLSPEEAKGAVKKNFEALSRDGHWEGEFDVLRKDGTTIPAHIVNSYLKDASGTKIGFIGISSDITRQRWIEEQLLQSQKLEALGTLAGGVAHDMNNVLAVILGFASVIESEIHPSDPLGGDIREISQAARRGKSLVENLLAFARKSDSRQQVVSVAPALRDLGAVLARSLSKGISIDVDSVEEGLAVRCAPTHLTQVLMNCCLNARDALGDRGRIQIRARAEVVGKANQGRLAPGRYVCIEVIDEGVGMDEETRRRALEPFFTTKDVGKGTGLGLSIAYGFVEQAGGAIAIDSAPGVGTTVSLRLPAVEDLDVASVRVPATPADEASGPARGRVLIVDDEALMRSVAARILKQAGFGVAVASGGREALDTLSRDGEGVELVLLDLAMPEMDGAECFRRIRELQPQLPVLLCTGHGRSDSIERMLAERAVGIVRKPFEVADLLGAIDALRPGATSLQ